MRGALLTMSGGIYFLDFLALAPTIDNVFYQELSLWISSLIGLGCLEKRVRDWSGKTSYRCAMSSDTPGCGLTRGVRKMFNDVRYLGYKQHFGKGFDNLWARGYYCGSAGHVSQEQVKRYILEQEGKSPFEYDVFNAPKGQMKVGDFIK